jgi:hypothetical protein
MLEQTEQECWDALPTVWLPPTSHLIARFGAQKVRAMVILIHEANYSKAAQMIGVSRSTIYRWLDDVEFRDALRALREDAAAEGLNQLKGLMLQSVFRLKDLCDDEDPRVRLQANKFVLQLQFRVLENESISHRLDIIEDSILRTGHYR